MINWNHREFFYLSASPLIAARAGTSAALKVTDAGDAIRFEALKYVFEWT